MDDTAGTALRIGYVPGVTVAKWARRWADRFPDTPLGLVQVPQAEQESALREGRVQMCFVRIPIDREDLHLIPLYREQPVVVVPKDHPISLFDEVSAADLADERMQDAADIDAMAATVELVVAVGGAAIMPHSVARLHHRRDLVSRVVTDLPDTEIGLAWPVALDTPAVHDFIGIVRGRTERSSRSETPAPQENPKRTPRRPNAATAAARTPARRQPPAGRKTTAAQRKPPRRRGR
ncbi:LysR family substrate-binding domain-containing protein [Nocardia sp. alder85J]|uniref:LysR family substrate-binding domain-containing protein n=1 Tax=Nocardia sp. alder85J TaxID=2862949 RepID=UPI001CD7E76C|nr:LysR family substrate-binding domain-containing protein [Nocardia sp. alder85J]MCX4094190.1 LysR family substrate-binding domain-containing protein [Nocardia sp. alder85J]